MNSYLLLRSNKQSGPFNLQQLVNMGLKPYDLLWVEGKSAAWSYPSEVEELKPYAPVVEEQPFDRFYKKPGTEIPKPEKVEVRKPEEVQVPVYTDADDVTEKPARKVYVSLPANSFPERNAPSHSANMLTQSKAVKTGDLPETKAPELKEEFSESLDNIKKRYEEIYLKRKKNNNWKKNLNAVLQVTGGAVFICILAVVVYKNFSTEENPSKSGKSASGNPVQKNQTIPVETKSSKENPVTKKENQSVVVLKNELKPDKASIAKQDPGDNQPKTGAQKSNPEKNYAKEKNIALPVAEAKKETAATSSDVTVKPLKKEAERYNIRKLVGVNANNFKRRPFGGILNLQLTVTNDSRFDLETVVVELQYLKPSEQPLKTEKIIFNSIAPHGTQTIKVPDFLRGVAVSYRITSIESSSFDKYMASQ